MVDLALESVAAGQLLVLSAQFVKEKIIYRALYAILKLEVQQFAKIDASAFPILPQNSCEIAPTRQINIIMGSQKMADVNLFIKETLAMLLSDSGIVGPIPVSIIVNQFSLDM